jgi:hypothetical protein
MNDGEVGHRPEVAIPVTQPLWIEASIRRPDGAGNVAGYAIAVGWDRPQASTFYLVSDAQLARPMWIPEADVASNLIKPLS